MAELNKQVPDTQDVFGAYAEYSRQQEYLAARERLGLGPEGGTPEESQEPQVLDPLDEEQQSEEKALTFDEAVRQQPDNLMPLGQSRFLDADLGIGIIESPSQLAGGAIDALNKLIIDPAMEGLDTLIAHPFADARLTFRNPRVQEELNAEILDNANKFPQETTKKKDRFKVPTTPQPRTTTGSFIRDVAEYLTALAGVRLGLKKVPGINKLRNKFTEVMMASPIATLLITEKEVGNVFTVINEHAELNNLFLRYLADNDPTHEEAWESDLKDVISDLIVGIGGTMLFVGLKAAKEGTGFLLDAAGSTKAGKFGKQLLDKMSQREIVARRIELTADEIFAGLGKTEAKKIIEKSKEQTGVRAAKELKSATERSAEFKINWASINNTFDIQKLISELDELDFAGIAVRKGPKKTFKRLIKESDEEFKDLTNLLGHPPGIPMSGGQAVKIRQVVELMAREVQKQAIEVARDDNPVKKVVLKKMVAVLTAVNSTVGGAKSDASASLRAFNVPINLTGREQAEVVLDIVEGVGGAKSLDNMAALLADSANLTAVIKGAKSSSFGKWGRSINTYRYESMLSGPGTVRRNFLGNSFASGWMIPERYMAALHSQTLGSGKIAFGEANTLLYSTVTSLKDSMSYAFREKQAAKLGHLARNFQNSQRLEGLADQALRAELFGARNDTLFGRGINLIGYIHAVPLKVGLSFVDRFFKAHTYSRELRALSYRKARGEGLSGEAMDNRIRELVANPPANLHMDSVDMAKELTFTNDLDGVLGGIQQGVRRIPVVGEYLNPYARSKGNLFLYSAKRSLVFAPFVKSVRKEVMAGGARTDMAIARIEAMSILLMVLTDYGLDGKIIGHLPPIFGKPDPDKDPATKDDFHARTRAFGRNVKPCSFESGGKYYSFDNTSPFGEIVCAAGDIAQVIKNSSPEEQNNLVTEFILTYWEQFDFVATISGLVDFAAALDDRNRSRNLTDWLNAQAGQFVPWGGLLRQIRKAEDPVIPVTRTAEGDPALRIPLQFKKGTAEVVEGLAIPETVGTIVGENTKIFVEELLDAEEDPLSEIPSVDPARSVAFQETLNRLKAGIPGLSRDLPAARNMYGEVIDISSGNGHMFDLLLGGFVSDVDLDPFKKLMDDIKVPLGMPKNYIPIDFPSRKLYGVKMTNAEYMRFVELSRVPWKKEMDEWMQDPTFLVLPDAQKVDQIIYQAQTWAILGREQIKEEFPRIRMEIDMRTAKAQADFLGESIQEVDSAIRPPVLPIQPNTEKPSTKKSIEALLNGE